MIKLTEDQVNQLINTLKEPDKMKNMIAVMFLESLLEESSSV